MELWNYGRYLKGEKLKRKLEMKLPLKPYIHYIKEYRPVFYNHNIQTFTVKDDYFCPAYPMIIKSNGEIWEYSTSYLDYLFIIRGLEYKTLKSTANDLLAYLRFLENNNIDFMDFPFEIEDRVTYKYHIYLRKLISEKIIRPSTASQRINRVLRFYDYCFDNLFIEESKKNKAYKIKKRRVKFNNELGFEFETQVISSDLAIKSANKNIASDIIIDGGRLHPLDEREQIIFKKYLYEYGTVELILMCMLALTTGARLQTIATIDVETVRRLIEQNKVNINDGTYSLPVGGNTPIDTKGGKLYNLRVPVDLLDDIYSYINSEEWEIRSKLSFYNNEKYNYVFLTKKGNPFYTSKKEWSDRGKRKISFQSIKAEGNSVRALLNKVQKIMINDKVEINYFSFHDLRATFGVNLLKKMLSKNIAVDDAIIYVKERLCHKYLSTTNNYLKYLKGSKEMSIANSEYEKILY